MESARVATKTKSRRATRTKSTLREYVEAIVLAVLLTVVIRGLVVQAFRIPTGSMEDTLLVGDFLFVNKLVYGSEIDIGLAGHRLVYYRFPAIRQPHRGDVIVFRYPDDPSRDFIKRCVAVEGQTIEIKNKSLYVNDTLQREPYVKHSDERILPREISARDNFGPFVVPKGHIFMMGDNRDNSHDSRFWGPLPLNLVKGKAMILYWSWEAERSMPRFNRLFHPVR
ncbi:MAG: signal peptidase I [Candidatus Eisenbacteria bacterium]|uniref:Signal peptidase I n=1 Tax=Eiseniibacteriota bacterium TaxID=2212470 RepID=A0A538SQJ0_UNCEI|nr:MAG: signal peptidase I [Candidatus Eisenbacteria bacterium]TMQ67050.1 MAG: signal peptidase I [Candidatus Eisenbacteria bacterium]